MGGSGPKGGHHGMSSKTKVMGTPLGSILWLMKYS